MIGSLNQEGIFVLWVKLVYAGRFVPTLDPLGSCKSCECRIQLTPHFMNEVSSSSLFHYASLPALLLMVSQIHTKRQVGPLSAEQVVIGWFNMFFLSTVTSIELP